MVRGPKVVIRLKTESQPRCFQSYVPAVQEVATSPEQYYTTLNSVQSSLKSVVMVVGQHFGTVEKSSLPSLCFPGLV